MALIRLTNGKEETVTAEVGAAIWQVLTGELDPTPDQEKFVTRISKIYLNWRNAPDSYIAKYLDNIISMALSEWLVDRQGRPTRPSGDFAWAFAKRWGLWENGRPSALVLGGQQRLH